MKKAIVLSLLFLGITANAQDMEYAKSLNSINPDNLMSFAQEMMSSFKDEYEVIGYKDMVSSRVRVVVGVSTIIPKESREKYYQENGIYCDLCQRIEFNWRNVGEDRDLGIKGVKTYYLYQMSGKFLNLGSWWQKHFAPDKTLEQIRDTYNFRAINSYSDKVNIRLQKSGDDWTVTNVN